MTRFDDYRDSMNAALARYREHAAIVQGFRDTARGEVMLARAHPHAVAGMVTPVEYDVNVALEGNTHYELARTLRDSAQRAALMWGVGALVEAQARR